jgi:NAD(P)H-hydrate repair Nnr-like enzyme with NAD(P)H-hydrate dehydratase domain
VNATGTPWLATAGTGDVLSGLAGALLAQGLDPAAAGMTAAFLHGVAARRAAAGVLTEAAVDEAGDGAFTEGAPIGAADVVRALPDAIRAIRA